LQHIVNHGGPGFSRFHAKLQSSTPKSSHIIAVHKTSLHPLPTWKINKSTIVGNAEVDKAIVKELHLHHQSTTWMEYVCIIAGDQLSIAWLRSLENIRAGHQGGYRGFSWGAWMPGLFHGKITDMHGFFITHWGKPNAGTRNPGCLSFHNTLLRHLPISLPSLPTFRICRDLVFVSLYARILHCLLIVSGQPDLDAYSQRVRDWETLEKHATAIVNQFANPQRVANMRQERKDSGGDMILENSILFLRDALVSCEFTDAVKCGDSGQVVLVLKVWALGFRGNGHSKYAHKMLHFLHNISKVWPKKIVDIILNNWLLNPSGCPNLFVEVDLVQEHTNFWIKVFYKAHGSNTTWEWLEMVSPCIYALRHLATSMRDLLGSNLGARHCPPDLTRDINVLMKSLQEHKVYKLVQGRKLNNDNPPVTDVIAAGLRSLLEGDALDNYNENFQNLQQR
ncbi:hypothetical protein FA15DRAFT_578966, partial [Coprinopsis marcescibilis]